MVKNKLLIPLLVMVFIVSFCLVIDAFTNQEDLPLSSFSRIEKYINSNKYTQEEDYRSPTLIPTFDEEAIILNTELGAVHLHPHSLSFSFENDNGYRWSSTINADDEVLPNFFLEETKSAIIIESFNTNNPNYAITKEYITGESTVELTLTIKGFVAEITFYKSRIKITLEVEFSKDKITVKIPQDKIKETGTFRLATIYVYPFFGAVKEDLVPGYVFVPDGVGALIRYEKENQSIIANYEKEIYNRHITYDAEVDLNKYRISGTRIYVPVFGFVHGVKQNGIFAFIKKGSEYANLNVYYPNRTHGYMSVFSKYVYRRTYRQPMNNAGDSIILLPDEMNEVNLEIDYTILLNEDADYVGMANSFQKELQLKSQTFPNTIPLRLETIGLEKTKGALFEKTIIMTKFSEFKEIINDLKSSGINNIYGVYSGFTANGSMAAPNYKTPSSKLGGSAGLQDLNKELSTLYLQTDFTKVSSKASGYNSFRDLSKKINDQLYQYQTDNDIKYLLAHKKTLSLINQYNNIYSSVANGLAIESFGSLLYYDNNHNSPISNQISIYQQALQDLDLNIALYGANYYLFAGLDAYFDFPMYSSQYSAFSDTVPFMAILLRGQIDLFAGVANFYPYARDELLRLIDFGIYPSFITTKMPSQKLEKTDLNKIYSSEYRVLENDIKAYYNFVSDALNRVIGARIIERTIVDKGLVLTIYNNGYGILINYNSVAMNYQDYEIPPKEFLVLEVNNE